MKSRAAFKLIEINKKYRLFRRSSGQIVVDLGFAPGSWSQVALDLTKPDGKVVGIDIIPAQPPRGVSAIQGNFLSEGVRGLVKGWLREEEVKREMVRERERQRVVAEEERRRVEMEREREAEEKRVEEEKARERRGEWGLDDDQGVVVGNDESGWNVTARGKLQEQARRRAAAAEAVDELTEGVEELEVIDPWQEELELTRMRQAESFNTWEEEALRRQRERQELQERREAEQQAVFVEDRPSYIELERQAAIEAHRVQEAEKEAEDALEQEEQQEQGQQQDETTQATTTAGTEEEVERKDNEEQHGLEFDEGYEQEDQQLQPPPPPPPPKKKKQNEQQMRLVDVRLPPSSVPIPIRTCLHMRKAIEKRRLTFATDDFLPRQTGSTIRHVRTLAPNHRLLHQDFE